MKFCPAGLATGIGSLPFTEEESALELIFRFMPYLPHWPQLPQKGEQEGFVYQYLAPLVNTSILTVDSGRVFFDTACSDWAEHLTRFYSFYLEAEEGNRRAFEEFAFPREAASGFYAFYEKIKAKGAGEALYFKGQLAGPLTIGFQLKDEEGRLAYYNEQLRDILVKALAMHACWQAKKLAELGRPAIIFIDDPAISVYGQFTFITVTREMIKEDISFIVQAIHKVKALAGLHSCDAIDWSILFESDLEIVSLDAYNYGDSLIPYAGEMKNFLERGGIIAWGIVPTTENAFEENEDTLLKKLWWLWTELEKRGIKRRLLLEQSLITPACGAGLLSSELATRIYKLNHILSKKIK